MSSGVHSCIHVPNLVSKVTKMSIRQNVICNTFKKHMRVLLPRFGNASSTYNIFSTIFDSSILPFILWYEVMVWKTNLTMSI